MMIRCTTEISWNLFEYLNSLSAIIFFIPRNLDLSCLIQVFYCSKLSKKRGKIRGGYFLTSLLHY